MDKVEELLVYISTTLEAWAFRLFSASNRLLSHGESQLQEILVGRGIQWSISRYTGDMLRTL